MPYSLLQTNPQPPSVEQLKRAFQSTERFTATDAAIFAKDAYGMLIKNLEYEDAYRIQKALEDEGVPVELVDQQELPRLPEALFIRRLEMGDGVLNVYDTLGRPTPVTWPQTALIAAGRAKHFEMKQFKTDEKQMKFDPKSGIRMTTVQMTSHKLETEFVLTLELIVDGGTRRFRLEAETFLFGYIIKGTFPGPSAKFAALAKLLSDTAPSAILNRGTVSLRTGAREPTTYPSKTALEDEMVWLLWLQTRATNA